LQSAPRFGLARSGARFISWDVTVQKTRSVVLKRARDESRRRRMGLRLCRLLRKRISLLFPVTTYQAVSHCLPNRDCDVIDLLGISFQNEVHPYGKVRSIEV
jgi:hypothetical protein